VRGGPAVACWIAK